MPNIFCVKLNIYVYLQNVRVTKKYVPIVKFINWMKFSKHLMNVEKKDYF